MIDVRRTYELDRSAHFRWFVAFMNLFGALPALLSAPFTFLIFVYSAEFAEHGLSSARAFTTLTLLGLLTSPLEKILKSIPVFTATFGCLDRIQAYLLLEIKPEVKVLPLDDKRRPTASSTSSADVASIHIEAEKKSRGQSRSVALKEVTVKYGSDDASAVLTDLSLSLNDGEVVMMIGPVGCGKSTLLKTLVGELSVARGSLWLRDPEVAYCQQAPWLMNGTIRTNIIGELLDSNPGDEAWYETVKSACALDEDVRNWPNGDDTKIGSGGIACSGGQKQRLVSNTSYPSQRPCGLIFFRSNCRPWQEPYMRISGWWCLTMFSVRLTPRRASTSSTPCYPHKDCLDVLELR